MPPPPQPPPHHLERLPRVLSIQSHVASGRVGNRAALFPLALHRLDCDAINTVSFSNHTGYPKVAGSRLSAEGLEELLSGLDANGFLGSSKGGRRGYDYVLTGYVGRAETLSGIKKAIEKMVKGSDDGNGNGKEKGSENSRRRPLVVVDPVMVRRFFFFFFFVYLFSLPLSAVSLERRERTEVVVRRKRTRGRRNSLGKKKKKKLQKKGDHDRARAGSSSLCLPLRARGRPGGLPRPPASRGRRHAQRVRGGGAASRGRRRRRRRRRGKRRRRKRRRETKRRRRRQGRRKKKGPKEVRDRRRALRRLRLLGPALEGAQHRRADERGVCYRRFCCCSFEGEEDADALRFSLRKSSSSSASSSSSSPLRRFPPPPSGATAARPAVWKLELPRIDAPFTGTGDLLTALLLGFLHKAGRSEEGEGGEEKEKEEDQKKKDLGWALERAAAGVRAVVDATVAGAAAEAARAAAEEEEEGEGEGEEKKIKKKRRRRQRQLSRAPTGLLRAPSPRGAPAGAVRRRARESHGRREGGRRIQ